MKKIILLTIFATITNFAISQTQNDTIKNHITYTPVTIDGEANENCWTNAEWHAINQVWMPFGEKMEDGDFEGQFKVTWDEQYLYLLVEIVDDMLSDDHSDPLSSWWDDDCLEIFIDENNSKGDHECSTNAFAYHVSQFYDAIDLSPTCSGINYKDHVDVKMVNTTGNTYLWEMRIKIYGESYNHSNPKASRIDLTDNKLMGITAAYCDNDEGTSRENFIGSMRMTSSTWNEMYKNADYFEPMLLIGSESVGIKNLANNNNAINIYPTPSKNKITIETNWDDNKIATYSIMSISGQILKNGSFMGNSHSLNIDNLNVGIYLLNLSSETNYGTQKIIKN